MADAILDCQLFLVFGILLPFLNRELSNLQRIQRIPEFILGILASWWPLRLTFSAMESGGPVLAATWFGLVIALGKFDKPNSSFCDCCTALCFSSFATSAQISSIGQGMSFGLQTGGLSLILAERIFSRLAEGWEDQPPIHVLGFAVVVFHTLMIYSIQHEIAYPWLHWKAFLLCGLVFLYLWTTPISNERFAKFTFCLAFPSLSVFLAILTTRFSFGEPLFFTRHGFALIHPNLLSSSYLISLILLDHSPVFVGRTMLRKILLAVLCLGIIGTQSRLGIALVLIYAVLRFHQNIKLSLKRLVTLILAAIFLYSVTLFSGLIPSRFDFRKVPAERLFIYSSALARISSTPLGEGFFQYGFGPQPLGAEYHEKVWDWHYPHTHQIFLEGFLTFGIPLGLVIFGYLGWLFFRKLPFGSLPWHLLLFHGLMGTFDMTLYSPFQIATLTVGVLGIKNFQCREKIPIPLGLLLTSGILLLATSLASFSTDLGPFFMEKAWNSLRFGNPQIAETQIKKAIELDPLRVEPYLYSVILYWENPHLTLVEPSDNIAIAQSLAPHWEIPKLIRDMQEWKNTGKVILSPMKTPHPDVTGFRGLFQILMNPEILSPIVWKSINKWTYVGEILLGLPPPFGSEFLRKKYAEAFSGDNSNRERLAALTAMTALIPLCPPPPIWPLNPGKPFSPEILQASLKVAVSEKDLELGNYIFSHFPDFQRDFTETFGLWFFFLNDFENALLFARALQVRHDPGNEGIPQLAPLLLEIKALRKQKKMNEATEKISTLLSLAPLWMEAREEAFLISRQKGEVDKAGNLRDESIKLILGSTKKPTSFSQWEFDHRPVGDNWIILFGKSALNAWLRKFHPGFIPFQKGKQDLLKFWEKQDTAP